MVSICKSVVGKAMHSYSYTGGQLVEARMGMDPRAEFQSSHNMGEQLVETRMAIMDPRAEFQSSHNMGAPLVETGMSSLQSPSLSSIVPAAAPGDLPAGWGQAMDSTYDRAYYYIIGTTHTQWERPSGRPISYAPGRPSPSLSATTHTPGHWSLEQKEDAIYATMLGYIDARCCGWSRQTWEGVFGKISVGHVFGESVWKGFDNVLHIEYFPVARGHVAGFGLEDWVPCFFQAPLNFSKAAAALPMKETNPPGKQYPAMIPCSEALRARREGPTVVIMICINILIFRSRPWYVHSSWISFNV